METLHVRTHHRSEFVDITEQVQHCLTRAKFQSGVCMVYCPHTTAGLTINEHADPDVARDMLHVLNTLVPKDDPAFRHNEGNSDSHVKASLMGSSVQVIVENSKLVLGTWQGIFLCEFDGPRHRTVHVRFLS